MMKQIKKQFIAVAAVAIVIGFSAFRTLEVQNNDPFYPMVEGVYLSTPLNPNDEDTTWECVGSSGICAGQFSTPPSDTHQNPDGEIKPGRYEGPVTN